MTPNELNQARAVLTRAGYHSTDAADFLVVSDPYHVSAPGGGLKLAGWTLRPLRTLTDAIRFVNDRT